MDQENAPMEEENAPMEEENAPREQENAPREQENAPREQENAPREQENAPREQENAPREQDVPTEQEEEGNIENPPEENAENVPEEIIGDSPRSVASGLFESSSTSSLAPEPLRIPSPEYLPPYPLPGIQTIDGMQLRGYPRFINRILEEEMSEHENGSNERRHVSSPASLVTTRSLDTAELIGVYVESGDAFPNIPDSSGQGSADAGLDEVPAAAESDAPLDVPGPSGLYSSHSETSLSSNLSAGKFSDVSVATGISDISVGSMGSSDVSAAVSGFSDTSVVASSSSEISVASTETGQDPVPASAEFSKMSAVVPHEVSSSTAGLVEISADEAARFSEMSLITPGSGENPPAGASGVSVDDDGFSDVPLAVPESSEVPTGAIEPTRVFVINDGFKRVRLIAPDFSESPHAGPSGVAIAQYGKVPIIDSEFVEIPLTTDEPAGDSTATAESSEVPPAAIVEHGDEGFAAAGPSGISTPGPVIVISSDSESDGLEEIPLDPPAVHPTESQPKIAGGDVDEIPLLE